jgi:endonuclease/exonuclease/phosphatase family metal-dependent hydrolase
VLAPVACLLLLVALLASALPTQADDQCVNPRRGFDTMTVNLYLGAGTERVLALDPTDPHYFPNLITAVTGVYFELAVSQPVVRLQGVADRIAARRPEVVAVEEASLIRIQSPGDIVLGGTTPATSVVYDYLQILVDALQVRGAHYAVVATSQEWDIEMPMLNLVTGGYDDVRQTDREAILVRTDLPPGQLRTSHPQSGHFTTVIQIPIPTLGNWPLLRGWCSVEVSSRGETFRYVCAHLEEETAPQIQVAQVQELLAGPAHTNLPVILVGDFNSDPLHRDRPAAAPTAYPLVIAAGFRDSWALLNPKHPAAGLTWGHDEYLADPNTAFDRRIDFVFFRGTDFVPIDADVLDMTLNRTAPPLWTSDHAALAVELLIEPARGGPH